MQSQDGRVAHGAAGQAGVALSSRALTGTEPVPAQPANETSPWLPRGFRRYALIVLQITVILSLLDRQVLNILAEPIKRELHLADWQIGALSGFTFVLFYAFFGIPIARAAEQSHRPRIIAAAMAIWSGFTVLSGLASNFLWLGIARMGVGIGEAGCSPPANSLIADYTPPEERASALALYHMGAPLGMMAGMVIGGLVADAFGWRAAFFVVGAPGLLFALIVALTLPEPRLRLGKLLRSQETDVSVLAALRVLWTKPTFWFLALGSSANLFVTLGRAPFAASFYFRAHGPQLAHLAAQYGLKPAGFVGLVLGLSGGVAAVFSVWLGGALADRLARTDRRAYFAIPAIGAIAGVPLYLLAMFVGDLRVSILLLAVSGLFGSLWFGPTYAILMSIVQPRMRATTAAVFLFVTNLLGLGLGPLVVGLTSDALAGPLLHLGSGEGVRWALVSTCAMTIPAFLLLWWGRQSIVADTVD